MGSTSLELEIHRTCKDRGIKPCELTELDIIKIKLKVQGPVRLGKDAAAAVTSLAKTAVLGRIVPLTVLNGRRGQCLTCPHSDQTRKGRIYCLICGCCGIWMDSALKDPDESCRLPEAQKRFRRYIDINNDGLPHPCDPPQERTLASSPLYPRETSEMDFVLPSVVGN